MEKIQETLQNNLNLDILQDLNAINNHLHLMKIINLWDLLLPKKPEGEMQEETPDDANGGPKPLKFISNILKILKKEKFKLEGIKASKLNQIYDGVYEGGCDVIYEVKHYDILLQIFEEKLEIGGMAIIASKAYYYGNGGSVAAFEEAVGKSGRNLKFEELESIQTGMGNRRSIFKVERLPDNNC